MALSYTRMEKLWKPLEVSLPGIVSYCTEER